MLKEEDDVWIVTIRRCLGRRWDGPCRCLRRDLRRTSCFRGRACRGWADTSRDACQSRWFLSLSWPCYKRTKSLRLFCRWFRPEEGLQLPYRLPTSNVIIPRDRGRWRRVLRRYSFRFWGHQGGQWLQVPWLFSSWVAFD